MATKTTKKTETAAKTEAVKAPVATAAKTEEKKVVKETKKVAPKTTKTKAVAKTATKTTAKAASAVKVFVEYQGTQMDMDAILEAVKAAAGVKTVKSLEVYVKPEDGAAYYVVNGKDGGKVTL